MTKLSLTAALLACATPAFADLDPCLVGNWQADTDDMAHAMKVVTNVDGVRALSGRMSMQVTDDGTMSMLSDGLTFELTSAGVPPVEVSVRGTNNATVETEGVSFWTYDAHAEVQAEARVMGMIMPFDSGPGLAGGASGIYGCTGDSLSFEPDGPINSIPRKWTRIE